MTWRGSLAPLRDRRFRWYFAARTVDNIGGVMGNLALAFAVLAVSDSPGALGVVLAAHSVPMVAFLLIGGVLADRFGRTQVIQVSNLVAGVSQLGIAALVITGTAEIWHLALLSAVNGLATAANEPALASLLPQLVPRDQLQAANVLDSLRRNVITVVGPASAGALVVVAGPGWAVGLNGVTFLLSVLLFAPVRVPAPPTRESSSILVDLREGWTFFRSTTWLWVVVLAFGVLNALHAGGLHTLGPALAKGSEIGEAGWGLVGSSTAAGFLVTTLVFMRVRLRRPLLLGMLGCVAFGLPMLALGLTTELWVVLLAAFVGGVGIEVFGLGWSLAMQEHVPEEMLSRAYSYDMLGSFVAIPVGQLAFGPLGATFGMQQMILVAGVAYAAICLLTLLSRSVRTLDRAATGTPTTPSAATSTTSAPAS